MTLTNILLMIVVVIAAGAGLAYWFKKNKNAEVEQEIEKDEKTYTLETMKNYVKKRLDEITKVNLYDIGLSEEELKRRKNKKYALKKALKGCTYGDVNDKRYVKELISDLLSKVAAYVWYRPASNSHSQELIPFLYTTVIIIQLDFMFVKGFLSEFLKYILLSL